MHFDDLLKQASAISNSSSASLANNSNTMEFPANWCQGRTAFGGLSAALLYQAIRKHIDPSRRLLSLSTNFVGWASSQGHQIVNFDIFSDCWKSMFIVDTYQRAQLIDVTMGNLLKVY